MENSSKKLAPNDLRHQLNQKNLSPNDLRHRLDQKKPPHIVAKGKCFVCLQPAELKCMICDTPEIFYCSVQCQKVDFPSHIHQTSQQFQPRRPLSTSNSIDDLNNNIMTIKKDINQRLKVAGKDANTSIDEFTRIFADKVNIGAKKAMFMDPVPLINANQVSIRITDIYDDTTKAKKIISGIQLANYADYESFKSSIQSIYAKSREILLFDELDHHLKNSIVMSQLSGDEYARCRIIGYYKSSRQGCFEDIDTGRKQIFDNKRIIKAAEPTAMRQNAFANKFQLESEAGMAHLSVGDAVEMRIKGKLDDGSFLASLDLAESVEASPNENRIMFEHLDPPQFELGKATMRFLGCSSLLSKGFIHVCENSVENQQIYRKVHTMVDEFVARRKEGATYIPEIGEIVLARRDGFPKFYRCCVLEVNRTSAKLQSIDFGYEFESKFINIACMTEKLPLFAYTCAIVVEGSEKKRAIDGLKTAEKLQKSPIITGVLDLDEFEAPELKMSGDDLVFK